MSLSFLSRHTTNKPFFSPFQHKVHFSTSFFHSTLSVATTMQCSQCRAILKFCPCPDGYDDSAVSKIGRWNTLKNLLAPGDAAFHSNLRRCIHVHVYCVIGHTHTSCINQNLICRLARPICKLAISAKWTELIQDICSVKSFFSNSGRKGLLFFLLLLTTRKDLLNHASI